MLSIVFFVALCLASQWDTYPQVPKSASINGFADPIYSRLPDCAKECVKTTTKITPCPYWDTGCFCVMPQWSGIVGSCFAQKCKGEDVASATSLAYSLCESAGANIWMMPASVSTELSLAAGTWQVAAATTKDSDFGDGAKLLSVLKTAKDEDKTKDDKSLTSSKASSETSSGSSATTTGSSSTGSSSTGSSSSASGSSSDSGASFHGTGLFGLILVGVLSLLH